MAGLSGAPARGSEVTQLKTTMEALERNARDRSALDEVFLGRFQVVEILGSGGMGTVFRGWDPRLQRAVALKTIHLARRESDAKEKQAASRLVAEAIAAAQIVHPNVVAIYDTEEVGAIAYVAMEYVHGTGLDRYLEERGKLSWREVIPLGQAICEGLAAAHARDLVHRDIKPGNILLGQDGSIKIADFGLALFLSQRGEPGDTVVGTPGFLSPEALRGRPVTAWSDLFAVGVLLCRSLTGHYPFAGKNLRAIVASTLNDPTPPVESFDERIPRALDRPGARPPREEPRAPARPGQRGRGTFRGALPTARAQLAPRFHPLDAPRRGRGDLPLGLAPGGAGVTAPEVAGTITAGLLLGWSVAWPPGPVNAEMIRRGLTRGFWPAAAVGFGACTADFLWALAVAGGAGAIAGLPGVRPALAGMSLVLLLFLAWTFLAGAFRAWQRSRHPHPCSRGTGREGALRRRPGRLSPGTLRWRSPAPGTSPSGWR